MTARNGHAPSGTGMGFLFWISHVRRLSCNPLTTYRLPLTTYQLPLAICHCHSPPPASPARGRVRGYILSLCHFALDDTFFNLRAQWETFATMGYQMTTCHEADTTFSRRNGQRMPSCLADWLPGSIQFQLEPVLNRFLLLFFFSFFSRFSIFPIFVPLGSFAFVVGAGSVRSIGIIVAPCGQFVGCFCGSM